MNPDYISQIAAMLPASILGLATATSPYALIVDGEALAPRVMHGQLVAVTPAVNTCPSTIPLDSIVLAAIATDPNQPWRFDRPALFLLGADLELSYAPNCGSKIVERGTYIVLGIVQEGVAVQTQV